MATLLLCHVTHCGDTAQPLSKAAMLPAVERGLYAYPSSGEGQHLRPPSPTPLLTEEKGLAQKHTMTVAEPRPNLPIDSQERWQEGVVCISHCPWPPDSEKKDTTPLPGQAIQSTLAFSRETKASNSPSSQPPRIKPKFQLLLYPNPSYCCFRVKVAAGKERGGEGRRRAAAMEDQAVHT